tara:strand:+ start:67 stop:234 length:168 start_codon:yes stop_codon:yes gene_type:complete
MFVSVLICLDKLLQFIVVFALPPASILVGTCYADRPGNPFEMALRNYITSRLTDR